MRKRNEQGDLGQGLPFVHRSGAMSAVNGTIRDCAAMLAIIEVMLLAVLAILLCVAALGDVRSYRIPNTLNLAISALAIPYCLINFYQGSLAIWPQIILITSIFAIMATLMMVNILGGGDAKLFLALAFWLPPQRYLDMILYTALAGGLMCVIILLKQSSNTGISATGVDGETTATKRKQRIPYGVAIAAGGLIPVSQLILNALVA
jgi:prepilin peptidase CpaA